MSLMTRDQHLQWAKDRAREYIGRGDASEAFASMCSDLSKHEDLRDHVGMQLGLMQLMAGHLQTPEAMGKFIEGFN